MSLSNQEIKEILTAIAESGWDEAHVTVGDVSIVVSKDGPPGAVVPAAPSALAPQAAAAPSAAAPSTPESAPPVAAAPETPSNGAGGAQGTPVPSPTLGVFYRAPEPSARPFVEVGDTVAAGDVLCIIEVMKLMNQVTAEFPGVVTAIHATNGEMVESGDLLMSIQQA